MIEIVHVAPRFCRESILRHGLKPSKVLLEHHLKVFHEDKIIKKNNNKILYGWVSNNKNDKFIKDMIFCKTYITPRNKIANMIKNENRLNNYKKLCKKNLYFTDNMIFDVYRFNVNTHLIQNYIHLQFGDDNDIHNTLCGMPTEFEHDDKPLFITKYGIPSDEINVVGSANWYFKNGKNHIKIIH